MTTVKAVPSPDCTITDMIQTQTASTPPLARIDLARRVVAAMDLTLLDDGAAPARVLALCATARSRFGAVAAVCIQPEHIGAARAALDGAGAGGVRVATVANFPAGEEDAAQAAQETAQAVAAGAGEVDVVFPYRALRAGNERLGHDLIAACKQACADKARLKAILETGELHSPCLIRRASEIALAAGADFLKTSTGRTPVGATPEAAAVMLEVLAEHPGRAGLKVSGGIRDLDQAARYFDLIDRRMGPDWATPAHFRIGASRLLEEALAVLGGAAASA